MLTSNDQLGYVLIRGGGQAVQGGLSYPPPRISERMDNLQILIHHLLQEYLVERDINFTSVNLKCLLQTFSWVTYWQGVGGKLSRTVYLAPRPDFQREWMIRKYESGSFRPLSRSPLSRFAHFPFRPESFRPLSRSPLGRFAHFPVSPWVVSPPYKILFLVLLLRPQKWYKVLIFLLIDDFSL